MELRQNFTGFGQWHIVSNRSNRIFHIVTSDESQSTNNNPSTRANLFTNNTHIFNPNSQPFHLKNRTKTPNQDCPQLKQKHGKLVWNNARNRRGFHTEFAVLCSNPLFKSWAPRMNWLHSENYPQTGEIYSKNPRETSQKVRVYTYE